MYIMFFLIVHFTLQIERCTLYTVHCTPYNVRRTLYTVQRACTNPTYPSRSTYIIARYGTTMYVLPVGHTSLDDIAIFKCNNYFFLSRLL